MLYKNLTPNSTIVITTLNGTTFEGEYRESDDDFIRIWSAGVSTIIPIMNIIAIQETA